MEFKKAQQKIIRNNLDLRLKKVLDEGRYILGEEVQELETKLSHFVAQSIQLHVLMELTLWY